MLGEADALPEVPTSTYWPVGATDPFRDLGLEEEEVVVPSDIRFFLRGGCCCSIRRNESSTIATLRFSLSVSSVSMLGLSREPCRAGVRSRLGGLLRDDSECEATSSAASSACPSLAARLFVACPVLVGEIVCPLDLRPFFGLWSVCILSGVSLRNSHCRWNRAKAQLFSSPHAQPPYSDRMRSIQFDIFSYSSRSMSISDTGDDASSSLKPKR
jgi:hypothetical protein